MKKSVFFAMLFAICAATPAWSDPGEEKKEETTRDEVASVDNSDTSSDTSATPDTTVESAE